MSEKNDEKGIKWPWLIETDLNNFGLSMLVETHFSSKARIHPLASRDKQTDLTELVFGLYVCMNDPVGNPAPGLVEGRSVSQSTFLFLELLLLLLFLFSFFLSSSLSILHERIHPSIAGCLIFFLIKPWVTSGF